MAKQGRRQYTEEFKREAVKLVDEQGRGIAEVARSLGVHRSQVERWRAQYGRGSAPSAGRELRGDEAEELKRLRAEVKQLRMEREILKKAAAFFAKECRKRRFRLTTDSRHRLPVAENLLDRQFDVSAPNQVWAADITYLWTNEGWLYLAAVIDRYARRVVGWALSDRIQAGLVCDALRMAVGRRRPPPGLIHHSDRGSQYAGQAYQDLLREHGLTPSMSRKGNCWDNAPMERFFGSLKRECTDLRLFATRDEARSCVIEYIEMFYNSRRRHSYLDYVSPMEYESKVNAA